VFRRKLTAVAAATAMTIALSGAQAQAAPFTDYTDDACMNGIIAVLIGYTAPIGPDKESFIAPIGSNKGS
jgi:hypothetical protein